MQWDIHSINFRMEQYKLDIQECLKHHHLSLDEEDHPSLDEED